MTNDHINMNKTRNTVVIPLVFKVLMKLVFVSTKFGEYSRAQVSYKWHIITI